KKDNRFANRITLHHHIIHRRPPSKSEDHDRFSLLPLCHAFLHPIALVKCPESLAVRPALFYRTGR
ncbi:MAG: hypothetical protein ABJN75_22130, partial [Hoeflea sp.]|uniref:hypothetical protein n=1 Tax=Hoeflea sp. TaxID=1940281 RepID=UPI00329921E9